MKKILVLLTVIVSLLACTSYATEEYLEFSSGEVDDGSIYLDSYEDYVDAMQGVDEQKMYKEEYDKMIASAIENYDNAVSENVVKAKIIEVKETEEYYSYDTYGIYKIKYQPLNVEILEGKYKGQKFDMTYILTADIYQNINIKEVKQNQKINVIIEEYEGEPYVYATTVDSAVNRFGYTLALVAITIILMGIYLGKNSLKLLPQLILLADIVLLVFVPEVFAGRSILWLTLITIILYVITNTTLKVGLNAKMVASILTTFAVLIITTIGLIIFNNISSLSGILYEVMQVMDNFPKGTINFNSLNLMIYALIATIVISEISCKVINVYSDLQKEESRIKIKEYVSEKILTVGGVLFITIIPKYLYMLIAKYSNAELLNSEMLTNEIARILFLIIAMLITTEITIITKKLFVEEGKK